MDKLVQVVEEIHPIRKWFFNPQVRIETVKGVEIVDVPASWSSPVIDDDHDIAVGQFQLQFCQIGAEIIIRVVNSALGFKIDENISM